MKRTLFSFVLLSVFAALISVHPNTVRAASKNNFTITSYAIDYTLGRDSEQRSMLTTKETIVADFPTSDENHGIERAIPKEYNGHSTNLTIQSVVDENGKPREYAKSQDSDFQGIRIGNPNKYLHGENTFVITYIQRDVTQFYKDTNVDEFYWDTNGTDWKVPIKNFSTKLTIDDSLASVLTGKSACYQGFPGSNTPCDLQKNGNSFSVSTPYLNTTENITIAIGFKPGTFAEYRATAGEVFFQTWLTAQIIIFPLATIAFIAACIRWFRQSNRTSEQKPIAPEYTPPSEGSVAESVQLFSTTATSSFPAQLIDLAVRGYIKLYEVETKGFFSKKTDYSIEIAKDVKTLKAEEQEFVRDVFQIVTVGSTVSMKDLSQDHSLSTRLLDNKSKLQKLERGTYALRQKASDEQLYFYKQSAVLAGVLGAFLLSPILLALAGALYLMTKNLWPLTDKGLLLLRQYKGLKMYIGVAEKDRLKMLQSPEAAEKVTVDTTDTKQLVKLYEKALPYAMLFGQSKEWNKQLGQYYNDINTQPTWYAGAAGYAAFNAASFESAMSSFASSAASSSGTGGSSGGGSSGGGGGGGGGGGW